MHARYSVRGGWMRWLFEQEAPPPRARLLELGCGPAGLWEQNLDRIDPSWQLTLTDFSPGMIEAARRVLGDRAAYVVCNAEELPFPDESFDVVIANHMLYHVDARPKAFAEIARVLVPGGTFHASTNGHGHLRQLADLMPGTTFIVRASGLFGLESGAEQVGQVFADVRVERRDDALEIDDSEPVLAYIRSSEVYDGRDLAPARAVVESAIARDGAFHVDLRPGVITCRKP